MALYNSSLLVLDRRLKERRRSFGPIGHRLAGLFRSTAHSASQPTPPPLTHSALQDGETVGDHEVPRFPLARRGYDCVAVDGYVADLERELAAVDHELAELRGSSRAEEDVASELKRLGEQTSAVLMAAHEQREEILRRARAEAEQCVADAKATAVSITAQFEERLRDLKGQTDAAHAERERLLGGLRTISRALAAVADSAEEQSGRTEEFAPVAT
jgi:hypothetical protein